MEAALIAALFLAQPQQAPPVRGPQQAPPVRAASKFPIYNGDAVTNGAWVTFVGCDPREVPGARACMAAALAGYPKACVVVSMDGYWRATLPADADNAAILNAVEGVSRKAIPFPSQFAQPEAHADAGSLPESIKRMLNGATRYQRARFTQSIAVVDNRDDIRPVPREQTDEKYQVPGGLAGIHGWASDLYRSVDSTPNVRIVNIPVLNSLGYFQNNRGYARAYPIGTWFADVLSKDGQAFEVRVREKEENGWVSYVAWKNVSARPAGYVGAMQSCASCHQEAGSGKYGVGLVPGGDETISDPFQQLER